MSNFTEKQLQVINHNFGNIVVSAAAGSGKTSVMVERLIRLISEGYAGVKEILAVTFTRLAATEMRDRLQKALIARIKVVKDKNEEKRLRKELNDLPLASISTIDSFLNALIKKYFYLAGVDSSYGIIAESEVATLKDAALTEVLERLYDVKDEDAIRLLSVFIRKRKDDTLKDIILKIYNFLESETDWVNYLELSRQNYTEEGVKNIENGLIGWFLSKITANYNKLNELFSDAVRLKCKGAEKKISACKVAIEILAKTPTVSNLKMFAECDFGMQGMTSKDDAKAEFYASLKNIFNEFKFIKKRIPEVFYVDDSQKRIDDALSSGRILNSLIKVIYLFDEEYKKLKRDKNALDYSDLSHISYKLLQIPEVENDVRDTYKFIFVDEYQDTNHIQESIFRLLENDNLFLVGDLKQSIYSFRGCNSDIFAARIAQAQESGCYVELDTNFRSSSAVISTVNKIFSSVMTNETMGIDYRSHPMVYGGLYGDYKGKCELFCMGKDELSESISVKGVYSIEKHLKLAKTATASYEKLVAYTVLRALDEEVCDITKDGPVVRTATYKDIAILARKNQTGVDRIVKELDRAGIPVVAESKRSVKEYPEIILLIDILNYIVAPDNEIALASALKSPIGNLTDRELMKIKTNAQTVGFCEAVNIAATADDQTAQKLKEFFSYIKKIRTFSAFEGVPTILRRIIKEKNFENIYLSTVGGEFRLRRIEILISAGYAGGRELTVQEFTDNIDMRLKDITVSPGGSVNAVTVMSMHASKGLEYPIVIVADLSEGWNKNDLKNEVLCDRNVGIGLKYYDMDKKAMQPTIVRANVDSARTESNLKDELRLLYVALTRARCILYVVSKKMPEEVRESNLLSASNHLALISTSDFKCNIVEKSDLLEMSERSRRRKLILHEPDEGLVEEIKKFVNYEYPFKEDTRLSIKRTVTRIVQNAPEEETQVKPVVIEDDEYTALKRELAIKTGNAYHKFLELFDFEKIDDNGLIEAFIAEKLTAEERELVDTERIKKILKLPLFKTLKGYKLYKEQPFIVAVPPEMAGESGQEEVLLQGVIDLLCINGDKAIIIDYKHSYMNKEDLVKKYSKQLELYRYATEKALNLQVEKQYLVNLLRVEEILLN